MQNVSVALVEELRAELADAEAALAAKIELSNLVQTINRDIRLAAETVHALSDTRGILQGFGRPQDRAGYIEFRKELTITLAEYGFKVVPIGDKSTAVVVRA